MSKFRKAEAEAEEELLLDTSVVVRYLTDDPPDLAERAGRVIDGAATLRFSEVALVETAHVLASVYGIERQTVVDALVAFLRRRNVKLLHLPKPLAIAALLSCRHSKRFAVADAILWAQARHHGALPICTFDARFPNDGVTITQP